MIDNYSIRIVKPETICIIGQDLRTELNNNEEFIRFVTHRHDFINIEYFSDATNIISSNLFNNDKQNDSTVSPYADATSKPILFVLRDFQGDDFDTLTQNKCSIMGATCFLQSIMQNKPINIVPHDRPLHNLAMQDFILSFSGISCKKDAVSYQQLSRSEHC